MDQKITVKIADYNFSLVAKSPEQEEIIRKAAAHTAGAAFYALSHQHAHVGAAMLGAGQTFDGEYLALHVSGGTTDLLRLTVDKGIAEQIETIGSSSDITAGQLIDRIGVLLGYGFPAGAAISLTLAFIFAITFCFRKVRA